MGKNYREQRNFGHNSERSKVGFLRSVPPGQIHCYPVSEGGGQTSLFKGGNFPNEKERGDRVSSGLGEEGCFLLQPFPSYQGVRGIPSCLKSETSKQLHFEEKVQNGNSSVNSKGDPAGRLGMYSRSEGCIFSHSNISKPPTFSQVPFRKESISVSSSTVRSNVSPKSVHLGGKGGGSKAQKGGYQSTCLFGRLDPASQVSRRAGGGERSGNATFVFPRVSYQSEEVSSGSFSELGVPRGDHRFEKWANFSVRKEGGVDKVSDFSRKEGTICSSTGFSQNSGTDELLHRSSAIRPSEDAAGSVISHGFLEPSVSRIGVSGTNRDFLDRPPLMVGESTKFAEGMSYPTHSEVYTFDNRCVSSRLGGTLSGSASVGQLVSSGQVQSHKLDGDESSSVGAPIPVQISDRQECLGTLRQFDSSGIYQQGGGYQVTNSLLSGMGDNDVVHIPQYQAEMLSYPRQEESPRGYAQPQGGDFSNRVDVESRGPARDFQYMGYATSGYFCHNPESSAPTLCVPSARSTGYSSRCPDMGLERDVSICVPPAIPYPKGITEISGLPREFSHSGCSSVAREPLVSQSSEFKKGGADRVASSEGSAASASQSTLPSGIGISEIGCVAIMKSDLVGSGLSETAAARAASACRKSTIKTYDSKLKIFFEWAKDKDIDPRRASLSQIAEFFEFLFLVKNLAARSIRSYRSAIAKIHPGWDGVSVGRNTVLSDMIKAYFIERPPSRKLVPSWNLQLVLSKLCDLPFEPLCKAELKFLTLKTVFLLAMASGRRVSCLHALSVEEGHLRENQSGTTLVPSPGFLAKNESVNYMSKSIILTKMSRLSSIPEDRLLCPCRAISYYIKRTAPLRGEVKNLFLCHGRKDHRPASKDTVARWIVEAIRFAYDSASTKDFDNFHAHDTRSISTSWALFQGVSIQDILEAASWKAESTFSSFYVRDMVSGRADLSRTVIAAASSGYSC